MQTKETMCAKAWKQESPEKIWVKVGDVRVRLGVLKAGLEFSSSFTHKGRGFLIRKTGMIEPKYLTGLL